jgi:hypothetical protein
MASLAFVLARAEVGIFVSAPNRRKRNQTISR